MVKDHSDSEKVGRVRGLEREKEGEGKRETKTRDIYVERREERGNIGIKDGERENVERGRERIRKERKGGRKRNIATFILDTKLQKGWRREG